jgi:hypothetical protein
MISERSSSSSVVPFGVPLLSVFVPFASVLVAEGEGDLVNDASSLFGGDDREGADRIAGCGGIDDVGL